MATHLMITIQNITPNTWEEIKKNALQKGLPDNTFAIESYNTDANGFHSNCLSLGYNANSHTIVGHTFLKIDTLLEFLEVDKKDIYIID